MSDVAKNVSLFQSEKTDLLSPSNALNSILSPKNVSFSKPRADSKSRRGMFAGIKNKIQSAIIPGDNSENKLAKKDLLMHIEPEIKRDFRKSMRIGAMTALLTPKGAHFNEELKKPRLEDNPYNQDNCSTCTENENDENQKLDDEDDRSSSQGT